MNDRSPSLVLMFCPFEQFLRADDAISCYKLQSSAWQRR
jgi:hypothetical protein